MLERLIDRLTIAQALAHCRGREDDVTGVQSSLPVFTSAGSRVGDPWMLRLDWSQMPEDYLWSPGITRILQRTADSLPPRHRAALLVDTEGVAAADVATGLGEPPETVRRRLHEVRMVVRERLTAYFAAAVARG